jgi:hypothetical protein
MSVQGRSYADMTSLIYDVQSGPREPGFNGVLDAPAEEQPISPSFRRCSEISWISD